MSKIQPLADRVLVKPMAAEEKTIGGIIIPDSAKEKPLRGEVIAVGEGTKDEKMLLAEGDTVLYGKYAGKDQSSEEIGFVVYNKVWKKRNGYICELYCNQSHTVCIYFCNNS